MTKVIRLASPRAGNPVHSSAPIPTQPNSPPDGIAQQQAIENALT